LRTGKSACFLAVPIAICIAALVLDAAAKTSASLTIMRTASEIKSPKKAGPPRGSTTLGIVTDIENANELAATNEIAELIAPGQETGPHGEVALVVAATFDSGGLQNIRDVVTLANADMSIVPAPLLDRAAVELGRNDIHKSIVYVAPLYEEQFHLLAGSSIRDITDLIGKTVNLGAKNGAVDVLGRELIDSLGLDIKPVNLNHFEAVEAISNGEIAADLVLASKPLDSLVKYTSDMGLRLVAIPRLNTLATDFLPVTLTDKDYPHLIPRGRTIETIGARAVLIAYNWPRGSSRYSLMDFFVRTLFSRFSELQSDPHHPKWRDVDLTASLPGWTQFPPARRWLDGRKPGVAASEGGMSRTADRPLQIQDHLRSRK
jgi:NMT1-like family